MALFYISSAILVIFVSIMLARLAPVHKKYQILTVIFMLAASYWIYMSTGALPQIQQLKRNQQQKDKVAQLLQSIDGKQGLINHLKQRLQAEPNSAQGHYLLAKLLASDGHWQQAASHFDMAKSIEPNNINYQVNYAFAQWQLNLNHFNDQIRGLFKQVLSANPNQVDALNMLAMDAYQQKQYNKAIIYWRRLLKLSPPGSESAKIIEKAIEKATIANNPKS